ncbi:MAG: polyribonucleotide nucleotidyltransferase [Thermodesulfobacteriota bacterium]
MKSSRIIISGLIFTILINTSCGTVFYPERKGQINGRIDVKVAVGDALALLFFIIPGVIAFAVDFSNGTIYLPGTRADVKDLNSGEVKEVKAERKIDNKYLEEVIKKELDLEVDLDRPDLIIREFGSDENLGKSVVMLINNNLVY